MIARRSIRPVFVLGALCAVALYLAAGPENARPENAPPDQAPAQAAAPARRDATDAGAAAIAGSTRVSVHRGPDAWRSDYGCDVLCEQDPTARTRNAAVAFSPGEARWLARHGFLSRSDLARLRTQSMSELAARVRRGDPKATLFVGQALTREGRFSEIAPQLYRLAARHNSIPAHLTIANGQLLAAQRAQRAHRRSSRAGLSREARNARDLAGMSLLRAEAAGDYIATNQLAELYPDGVPGLVIELAGHLAEADARIHRRTHGRNPEFDPRPRRPPGG